MDASIYGYGWRKLCGIDFFILFFLNCLFVSLAVLQKCNAKLLSLLIPNTVATPELSKMATVAATS